MQFQHTVTQIKYKVYQFFYFLYFLMHYKSTQGFYICCARKVAKAKKQYSLETEVKIKKFTSHIGILINTTLNHK